jgi:hypothetical protein
MHRQESSSTRRTGRRSARPRTARASTTVEGLFYGPYIGFAVFAVLRDQVPASAQGFRGFSRLLRRAERVGFEPTRRFDPPTRFPVAHLKPLGHLSGRPDDSADLVY